MPDTLEELRALLISAIRISKQGSYGRREPATIARPQLEEARMKLQEFVRIEPANAGAWRLLSQAEESLLRYSIAVDCLKKAMALSKTRNKEDLKRLALLTQSAAHWAALALSAEQLRDLGVFLVRQGADEESRGRSLDSTKQWLMDNDVENPEAIITALADRGAYTDFQVLYNVVRG